MRLSLTFIFLLVGCGGRGPTLLEPGVYTVDGIYLVDTWPGGEPGKEFTVDMDLTVSEGETPETDVYRMNILESTTEGPGVVGDDGFIYFLIEHWNEKCGMWSQIFDAVYEPTSRTTFGGHSATLVNLCNVSAEGECNCSDVFFSSELNGRMK